ncbi:MAG TPA: excinuclease ABC subunit UvrC [Mariprofundaceae bacterium]|nr:excinuclease ABC subunit UvrC [Mariprofundaceae bacterium]
MWIDAPIELAKLPREPGVYRMLDAERKVLYVGKARNLRKRVSSYFQRRPESPRTEAMALQVRDIEVTVTPSEADALVLEHNLIKQLKPRYNVLLKDAKSYPYILLTDEQYPRFRLYRGERDIPGEYFGPFPDTGAVHKILHVMQKVFRIRDCEDAVFQNRSRPCMQYQIGRCSAPCCGVVSDEAYAVQVGEARAFLRGEDQSLIRQWEAKMQEASARHAFERASVLRDRIRALRTILAGSDTSNLPEHADALAIARHPGGVAVSIGVRRTGRNLGTHTIKVGQATDAETLEILQSLIIERYRRDPPPDELLIDASATDAEELQRLIRLLHLKKRCEVRTPKRGARRDWLRQVAHAGEQSLASRASSGQQSAFEALADLLTLDQIPRRIAAVDNAHLGGKQTVAAIVYADWDGPDKEHYRRYRLDDVPEGDDYTAMRTVLTRFFKAIEEERLPRPDLMFIDGGKGQLGIGMQVAADQGLSTMPLIGVAKGTSRKLGEETLWPSWTQNDDRGIGHPLKPGRHNAALLLIARVRDEAHRFAGEYLKKRRKANMFTSALDNIPGIGKSRRMALLKHFGGIEGVKRAGREQLAEVPGLSARMADRIFTALHR